MSGRKQRTGAVLLLFVAMAVMAAVPFVNVPCKVCGGQGKIDERREGVSCAHCHGTGHVSLNFKTAVCENNTRVCPRCNGTGHVVVGTTRLCSACGGAGETTLWKKIVPSFSPLPTPVSAE